VDLIIKFIIDQWENSGFILKENKTIIFSLKFKRVYFSSFF
jgi:hypothetical protein